MAIKLKENRIEGGVILALGLLMTAGAMSISDNPVRLNGWVDFIAEARFVPLIMSVVFACLGIGMLFSGKGKQQREIELDNLNFQSILSLLRITIIIAIHIVYFVMIGWRVPFYIGTFVYLIAFIALAAYKEIGAFRVILVTLVSTFTVGYLLPWVLEIPVP